MLPAAAKVRARDVHSALEVESIGEGKREGIGVIQILREMRCGECVW